MLRAHDDGQACSMSGRPLESTSTRRETAMRKLCRMVLLCAALIGLTHLTATSVEGHGKGKKPKPKQDNSQIIQALDLIHAANHNAKSAPKTYNRFGGHRNAAVKHMNNAIKELEHSLKHVKAKTHKLGKVTATSTPMHHALKIAHDALASAKAAPHDYGGHKGKAMKHMEHAIKELDAGIKYYKEHPVK